MENRRDYNKIPNGNEVKDEKVQLTDPAKPTPSKPEIKKPSALTLKMRRSLDHWITQTFMTTLTVYILFADDIKMICTTKDADDAFSTVCVINMCIFTIEFVISSFVVEDYFLGFYFWLDFVSIVSMLLDVHWFYDVVINSVTASSTTVDVEIITNSTSTGTGTKPNSNVKSISALAKAGKGAKVGSRAIRILRILRIIRLVRISKLYKASEKLIEEKLNNELNKFRKPKNNNNSNKSKDDNNNNPDDQPQQNVPQESKVGKKLSDLTTRRVIILVLAMMIGIILFNSNFYLAPLTSMDFGIKVFSNFDDPYDPNLNLTFDIYVNEHRNISSPIVYAKVGNLTYGNFNDTDILREAEKITASDDCLTIDPTGSGCIAVFDNTSSSRLASILNIIKTIFICMVLSGGAICFNKDTSEMVLEPIESMIKKIEDISKNPIEAMQNNEKEEYAKSLLENEEKAHKGCFSCLKCSKEEGVKKKNDAPLETVILENTITKIGALLALGFGEAGSEIIAKNMQNNANGDVNPLLPGKKVMAIYGFCDIRNFTDTTEVLQEKVMIFVNEIAEIVHEITAEHCGSANKNIGDAFLLVWKFEDQFVDVNPETKDINLINTYSVNQICDMALISFIKILAKVHKSYKLDKYRKNEGLNRRINNYCVKMGFGLHLGWSIEGAIGSTFKIDASYLSPNVNKASGLEEKTKEYGVQLVISGDFISYLSEEARKRVRLIDKLVGENGEEETVYTVDIDMSDLKIEDRDPDDGEQNQNDGNKDMPTNIMNAISAKKLEKYKKRMKRKMNYEDAINGVRKIWQEFEDADEDYAIMRRKYTKEFYDFYNLGFNHFQDGDWLKAKIYFEKANEVLGDKDGPTENLMRIMKENNFTRPADWKGNTAEHGH
jgi:class 3 adenylate cyclase